ncbi:DnaB-like helicase C-terminal domain-containing protein, partial [Bacillus subtilis]|uniref:DnaB-like helicase C-terminal domain-containing protein n=1 Tax=Bacillus subtilis TaxID=1423 RepID=UPI00338F05FA
SRRFNHQSPLAIIFIHYLQFIHATPPSNHNPHHQLSQISPQLNSIPTQLQLPVIPLSHLSSRLHQPRDKRPIIS